MKLMYYLMLWLIPYTCIASISLTEKAKSGISKEEIIYLVVDKGGLKAELRTWPEDRSASETLLSLRIAVGKAPGDKQVEGDNKTPEGIYFAQELISGDILPKKYGPLAIPINFPNTFDKNQGKTGYGIWLHGVERDARIEEANVTEGCVAFYNADIESLAKWLKPQQTVIVIAKDEDSINKQVTVDEVLSLTKRWQHSWQERSLNQYVQFYDPTFRFRGMNIRGFTRYKGRVFNSYKVMKVDFNSTRVFTHDKYAMAIMNQNFDGDGRYVSKGRKILYWVRKHGDWKIVHEIFEATSFSPQTYSHELFARLKENSPSSKKLSKFSKESSL